MILMHKSMKCFHEFSARCIAQLGNLRRSCSYTYPYLQRDRVQRGRMERLSRMISILNRFAASTNVKELIKTFELETILIYTALLLKKKIIVYHHSLEQLLKCIRTFPALIKHRKVIENLFPWIDLVSDELIELKKYSHYVTGCSNSSISSRIDLYDLLVNIPAREITVAPHAKESLTMTKTHKEIALFMVQLCENQSYTEAQVISKISDKTQDLLNQLTSLATVQAPDGKRMISVEIFKEKNLAPAEESFLINLAIAENLFVL